MSEKKQEYGSAVISGEIPQYDLNEAVVKSEEDNYLEGQDNIEEEQEEMKSLYKFKRTFSFEEISKMYSDT